MKKIIFASIFTAAALLVILVLPGCLKDKCRNSYQIFTPVFKTLTQVRAGMRSGQPQPVQQTGKIYVYGKYIFLNESNKGIHVIDNTNPAQPKNMSFINIPGNVDIAVKGSSLYADSYSDLVVFDISSPAAVIPVKFIQNTFPDRAQSYYGSSTNPDSIKVLVDYQARDTTVDCDTYNRWSGCSSCMLYDASGAQVYSAAAVPGAMKSNTAGGSMARFTVVNNYLYSVSSSQLKTFDVTTASDPQLSGTKNIGWNIETIYPFKNKLFIGSSNGMFVYDVSTPGAPSLVSQFSHVRSCDPVIADDAHAYVTLRSGTQCNAFVNELQVLDVTNLPLPVLLKTYPMTNPHGLSKDGDLLFICDGKDGLKVYNAASATSLKLLQTIAGIETYDVIANGGVAILVAKDGLYQFDYSNSNNIRQISRIGLSK